MICSLKGTLSDKKIEVITVDVNGVGYEVFVPLKTFTNLPDIGSQVFLHIQSIFKEDGFFLYGFYTYKEREVFNLLRLAKGVGVKTAFNLLSTFDSDELINAIANEDTESILRVPGIGKKSAERIIFELKDRVKKLSIATVQSKGVNINQDVELALVSLGYSLKDAREAIQRSEAFLGENYSIEEMIKEALKALVKR